MAKPCFLIVASDLHFAMSICVRLEQRWNPLIASTGKEALSLLSVQPASMTLLDLDGFPDMSGVELLKRIRGKSKTTKILVVANANSYELAITCADHGINGFLTKPIDSRTVVEKVNKIASIEDMELLKILWKKGEYEKGVSSLSRAVKKALEYVHQNYSNNFSRDEVADYANVSADHLSRLFTKECGQRFKDYVAKLRIHKSKELLTMHPDMKLKEVAASVGFGDVNYFVRFFKKHVKTTCTEFRRNLSS